MEIQNGPFSVEKALPPALPPPPSSWERSRHGGISSLQCKCEVNLTPTLPLAWQESKEILEQQFTHFTAKPQKITILYAPIAFIASSDGNREPNTTMADALSLRRS